MHRLFNSEFSRQRTDARRAISALAVLISFYTSGLTSADEDSIAYQAKHASRHERTIAAAEQRVASSKESSSAWAGLGDAQLRAGRVKESVVSFEKALAIRSELRPHLWQYGIALYFAGRHTDGRDLFVEHRRVNPHDVENAAWHFLCAAKATNPKDAKKILLPAPNDPRVPMNEILERLRGGDDKKILAAVERVESLAAKDNARFYAELYLGLIADAEGSRDDSARRWMLSAAKTDATHYMADVARVYASHLSKAAK